ncbi:MAG: hypothetical protein M1818_005720 [Claussenomyces sp. TS43310]|nr:MAG: hypothetical protein M1818_005720 [Claussenomyces sp. TS43310]
MSATPTVTPLVEEVTVSSIERSEAINIEAAPKLKGRQRLLHSLQRISSSPSLAQLSRNRSSSNPYSNRSTLSLASWNSPSTNGSSYSSQISAGPSTAPTSVPGSPIDSTYIDGLPVRLSIRRGERGLVISRPSTPGSAILSTDVRPGSRGTSSGLRKHSDIPELVEDYFSHPMVTTKPSPKDFDFWEHIPYEVKIAILSFLKPKELVKASIVNKSFHRICFDGQLWTCFDASDFYKDIPAASLAKIIVAAGPFVKDLNLRGCVQVEHYQRAEVIAKACRNLVRATLEGCRNFKRHTLHTLLANNERLAHVNLTGLVAVNNQTCKIIARSCPQLESLNVSWCTHMDAQGIKTVINGCPKLRDLRAGEIRGFGAHDVAESIFHAGGLERLVLSGCSDIDDNALQIMVNGIDPQLDILEDRPIVPPRKFRHLDLSRCHLLTERGLKALAHNVPNLQGLQLSGCTELTDAALEGLLATTPRLTHLDLEELSNLTNSLLSEHLAKSPCAGRLEQLSISYCENIGDSGVLPVIKECKNLRNIDMDNTRISDLVLAEAAYMVRERSVRSTNAKSRPRVTLSMVVFDCQNVSWTGVREVLSRNAEIKRPSGESARAYGSSATYPTELIAIKCFYGYQMTVDEHIRRVLDGNFAGAARLERKWADHMMMSEEVGLNGSGARRRRRRLREAAMLHADEEEGGIGMGGIGRRRRARSGGCAVM